MKEINKLDELIETVHNDLDYSKYDSTNIRNNTNCYAHAIGATLAECREMYRIGAISKKKPITEKYFSEEEIKNLFLEDMKVLGLSVEEDLDIKENSLEKILNSELKANEYYIILFVEYYPSGVFKDFHFRRFDEHGFSEKRFFVRPTFIDDPKKYIQSTMKMIGLFRIVR